MILDKKLSDDKKAEKLCEEFRRLEQERSAFESTWKEAQTLISSVELSFDVQEGSSTVGYKIPKRITNRPAQYMDTLVTGICGYGVNPTIKWCKLGLSDQNVMKRYGVKDWLEAVELLQYDEYDNSNFYTEQKMVVEQAATFGYGIMLIEDDKANKKVRYQQINVPEVYLDVNEFDEYETVFRHYFLTIENAVSHFGLDKMHHTIREKWNTQGNDSWRTKELEIIHAVFRRKNNKGLSPLNTEMPFASFHVDIANRHIIEESGYKSFPYAIFAWDRVGGLKYPISPAIKSVNDVKLLLKTEDTRLTLAQMAAKQPVAIPDSMRGSSEIFGKDGYIRPGAIVYYEPGDAAVPSAINMGSNYPITLDITHSQAETIKDWFFVDFFLMLQRQGNIEKMTATAVQALQGEKAATMTTMIVNLKRMLQVVVQRTYDIMSEEGRLPQLPNALHRPYGQEGNRMKFVFASVLSQIQQAALRYQGAQQFLPAAHSIAQLGQAYPQALEALDRFDFDIILQNEARAAHMPETAIREDEDVQAIKEQRAKVQAQREQNAQLQQDQMTLAQNYNKLNEPPKPGSPAEALLGMGSA